MSASGGGSSPEARGPENRRKRVRLWTPDDRAAHRIFEKSRREAFNDSLINLARQLPSVAKVRRLNKHMIVQESVLRHQQQNELCFAAGRQIQALITERNALLDELNVWRTTQMETYPPQLPQPLDEPLLQRLSTLPGEKFGTFPNGFGENPADEDREGSKDQDCSSAALPDSYDDDGDGGHVYTAVIDQLENSDFNSQHLRISSDIAQCAGHSTHRSDCDGLCARICPASSVVPPVSTDFHAQFSVDSPYTIDNGVEDVTNGIHWHLCNHTHKGPANYWRTPLAWDTNLDPEHRLAH